MSFYDHSKYIKLNFLSSLTCIRTALLIYVMCLFYILYYSLCEYIYIHHVNEFILYTLLLNITSIVYSKLLDILKFMFKYLRLISFCCIQLSVQCTALKKDVVNNLEKSNISSKKLLNNGFIEIKISSDTLKLLIYLFRYRTSPILPINAV